jgi:hypothetical protein
MAHNRRVRGEKWENIIGKHWQITVKTWEKWKIVGLNMLN